jgi:3-methyladenine DNA glycosylase AlkD
MTFTIQVNSGLIRDYSTYIDIGGHMTVTEVMNELETMGSAAIKKVFFAHGAREPFYGVRVQDLKKIQKRVKKNYELSMGLYATGNSDAMYLAGLIADEKKMTEPNLRLWIETAYWPYLSECTVPWVASETPYGWDLALEWIGSEREQTAAAGWSTLACCVSMKPDKDLDISQVRHLLNQVRQEIHRVKNRVRYCMNGFVIAVGAYVSELSELASTTGSVIGTVQVDMNGTACKVPFAPDYIQKSLARGTLSKKKKTCRC